MVEVLRVGYCLPFLSTPPLYNAPLPMPSYSPTSIKGAALEEVTLDLVAKGAVELAPLPSPGFYSRLFVVWKTSPISIALWTCLPFRWRPFSLCSCRCVRGTGWPPSISRKRIFRCRFILLLVTLCASSSETGYVSSKLPFLHPAVCRQVGVAHPFHLSLLLGEVLSRL